MMHDVGALLIPIPGGFLTNPHLDTMEGSHWVNVPCIYLGSFMQKGGAFFWVMLPNGEVVSTFASAVKDARV